MNKLSIPLATVLAVSALALSAGPAAADCTTPKGPVSGPVHSLEEVAPAAEPVLHEVDQPLCEAGL